MNEVDLQNFTVIQTQRAEILSEKEVASDTDIIHETEQDTTTQEIITDHDTHADFSDISIHDCHEVGNQLTFDESLQWDKQRPILGMKFESSTQLKTMLINYAVANGFQLCYMKNSHTKMLIRCSNGDCTFKLWSSWTHDGQSLQIKSLISDHNCVRNYRNGSIVTYKWIGEHFKKDFLYAHNLGVVDLKEKVKDKFGLQVSIGQCSRAKKTRSFAKSGFNNAAVSEASFVRSRN